jgi:hypothetical protein
MPEEITSPLPGDKGGVTPWYPTEHADLVKAKSWAGPGDALKSYAELERFRGAPADRLIMIPDSADKIDDTFRSDVFKRIGYNPSRAPATPEEYGVQFEGAPPEFGAELSKLAHKHGISKEALAEFAEFNGKFGKTYGERLAAEQKATSDARWTDRQAAVEGKLKERFGDKYAATTELMTREALRLGFADAAELEAYERNLALGGDEDLMRWRSALADLADARRESPLHRDGGSGVMTADAAKAALEAKSKDPEWIAKALTRGTPEAAENLRLNTIAGGGTVNEDELTRLSKGLTAKFQG